MAYYLVDYENVKADGMYGVDQLGKKDCVCIFYSENASTLTFGLHEKLNQKKGKIVLQKVEVGVKNALDFQLSTYLGYLISENEGKNETYYIVSEDKGLAILTGYWAERGENVKTASDIAAAKEDLEEEKSSKTEKKEKKEKSADAPYAALWSLLWHWVFWRAVAALPLLLLLLPVPEQLLPTSASLFAS